MGGIAMLVGDLGTWPTIAGIGEEGGQWRKEGWNIAEDESRRFWTMRTI